MRMEVFLARVQRRADLADARQAHRAVQAVLRSLAEDLPDGYAHLLGAALPVRIGEPLRAVTGRLKVNDRDPRPFLARVAADAGVDAARAGHLAAAVLAVTAEAVDRGLLRRVGQAMDDPIRTMLLSGAPPEAHSSRRSSPRSSSVIR